MCATPPRIQITPEEQAIVRQILRREVPACEVLAFGSRVRGTARPYSDLDLVIMTDTPLPLSRMAALKSAFSESDLPWPVDVLDWSTVAPDFQAIIQRTAVSV